MKAYIVVVYPAPPATRGGDSSATYTYDRHQASVKMVTASSPEKAADIARVGPGAHAFVIEKGKAIRFDRAREAPLECKSADGGFPLPRAA